MTGAECLLETLALSGIEVCFMNPGTSEMRFVAALDGVPQVRGVLCLFEGVCSGAADGYARMAGQPAAALLHLGPGLANALANLHNARKAYSPLVAIVGEHTTGHQQYDAPLSSDIRAFARPVSADIRVVRDGADMGAAAAETIAAAIAPPGQVATLIVPADLSWSPAGPPGPRVPAPRPKPPAGEVICEAARILRRSGAAILLGGRAACERGLAAAARLHAHLHVPVFLQRTTARIPSGRGRFQPTPMPYFPEAALALLAPVRHMILVEARAPVSFFGYPDTPSYLLPETCSVFTLAAAGEDGAAALEALADELPAPLAALVGQALSPANGTPLESLPAGPLTADAIGAVLAARLPAGAIVSDETITAAAGVLPHLRHAAPHDSLPIAGGSIGQGLPVALGASFACPDRPVIALEADGSAMYTLQALWTMARENRRVVTVIFANRRYRILDIEMQRTGSRFGPMAEKMIGIGRPDLDFVRLSEGMGVPATRAATAAEFDAQFCAALAAGGPRLIEAVLVS